MNRNNGDSGSVAPFSKVQLSNGRPVGSSGDLLGTSSSELEPPGPRDLYTEDVKESEFDSDDELWSDDEDEAGDFDAEADLGEMPQNHNDIREMKKREFQANIQGEVHVPDHIPFLNLRAKGLAKDEGNEQAAGWRRLPRPEVGGSFYARCKKKLTLGPDEENTIKPNAPTFMLPISPVDACAYDMPNFECNVESIFIPDARKDMERSLATVQRNIKREEELSRNLPTDDLLLFGEAKENTHVDMFLAKQYEEDQDAFVDPREAAMDKALLAAKSNNISEMEDALEEDIPINTADQYGNTLLILAAQQGSKRMVKFLLRRSADINAQSVVGNTCLHYCYAYSHTTLGDYLKTRGANDAIVNLDGLTCYEGLSMEDLKEEGDD
jgi:hypothetical protein